MTELWLWLSNYRHFKTQTQSKIWRKKFYLRICSFFHCLCLFSLFLFVSLCLLVGWLLLNKTLVCSKIFVFYLKQKLGFLPQLPGLKRYSKCKKALFYTHLSIQIQISKVFRVAFYHLKRIAKIRKYISRPATARPITRYWLVAESSACGCLLHHWSTPLWLYDFSPEESSLASDLLSHRLQNCSDYVAESPQLCSLLSLLNSSLFFNPFCSYMISLPKKISLKPVLDN